MKATHKCSECGKTEVKAPVCVNCIRLSARYLEHDPFYEDNRTPAHRMFDEKIAAMIRDLLSEIDELNRTIDATEEATDPEHDSADKIDKAMQLVMSCNDQIDACFALIKSLKNTTFQKELR